MLGLSGGQKDPGFVRAALARLSAAAGALRVSGQRATVSLLIFLSVAMLVLGKADLRLVQATSEGLADGALPLLTLLRQPIVLTREAAGGLGELLAVYEENRRLREENARLRGFRYDAVRLNVENRSLRELLGVPPIAVVSRSTGARVVADSAGSFVHTRLIDVGRAHDVRVGMPAVRPEGLVGRIVAVGERTARLMLLTDFNSRIPVVVGSSGDRAILEGDNSSDPKLAFLPLDPQFRVGDVVVTSGQGGMLPPGLAVGRIVHIEDGRISVMPNIDWSRLDLVSVLHYTPAAPPVDRGRPGRTRDGRGR